MPIYSHTSVQSQTNKLKKEWFQKADKYESDISRFSYLNKNERKDYWEFKVDLSDNKIDLNDTIFLINHDKFVNRPDAISYEVYGNAKYWWLIALRNDITEPFFEFFKGRKLKIPDLITAKKKLGFN